MPQCGNGVKVIIWFLQTEKCRERVVIRVNVLFYKDLEFICCSSFLVSFLGLDVDEESESLRAAREALPAIA
jgi:hypothetical protein